MENKCVCCGADIPEGRQVCPYCTKRAGERMRAYIELRRAYREKVQKLNALLGETKGGCKWYKDEFCVNADCPYVADFCPVAQNDSICKFRG